MCVPAYPLFSFRPNSHIQQTKLDSPIVPFIHYPNSRVRPLRMVDTETNERAEYDEEDLEVQGSTSVRKTDGEDEGDEDEQSYLCVISMCAERHDS